MIVPNSWGSPLRESNDCHNPSGPGGGQFCSDSKGGKAPIWKTPLKQYAPPHPPEVYLPEFNTDELIRADKDRFSAAQKIHRKLEREWIAAAKTAIATGEITPEQGDELAGDIYTLRPNTAAAKWDVLPEVMYHVTVNRTAVMKDGLKTSDERGGAGEGLGGGDSGAISFTTDKAYAGVIYEAILALHDVATGKTTTEMLIQQATDGVNAPRPFLNELKRMVNAVHGNYEEWAAGRKSGSLYNRAIAADELPPGAVPRTEGWMGGDGRLRYHGFTIPMTEEEKRGHNASLMNAFLTARQEAGGPENPWFGFNDAKKLAKIPREEIAVLRVRIKPGSRGWEQSKAEREWRVPTGKVIHSTVVLRTKNRGWQ